MTAPGQPNAADLPAALTRPLWGGFTLVAVFLLSVVLWSVYAPLATSVQAAGHLVALRPSFEIQHPFGGRIGQVFADEHQEVAAGDLLLRMDSAPQEAQLQEISAHIGALGQENEAARAFFGIRKPLPLQPKVLLRSGSRPCTAALLSKRKAPARRPRPCAGRRRCCKRA